MLRIVKLLAVLLLAASSASAACHAVSVAGAGTHSGADWNNSMVGIPATPVRGDIYYLADGNYGSYHFQLATSGTTTTEFRKAQSYDFGTGAQCSASIGAGWNTATMGSSQAQLGGMTISKGYGIFNGNGTQTTPGCGGGGSNFTTGTNAALISAIEGPPPTPKDCGIKVTGIFFDSAATTNDVIEYVELLADSTPANNDDFPVLNSGNNTVSAITFTHVFGHNSAATYLVYMGHSGIRTYNYWWGTEVQGPDNNGTHGQYNQDCGNCGLSNASNNTVDAYSVMRDIAGTAVWTFLSSGTVSGWKIYGNVIYNTPGNSIGGASDAVLDCINSVTCSGFTFNQNTIMTGSSGPYGPQAGIGWGDAGGGSVTVENNLWYNIGSGLANITKTGSVTVTEDHNSLLNAPSTGGFSAATDVKVSSGSPNPFVNSSGNNFSLTSDNANWNNRAVLGAPYNVDVAGNTFTTDRGAYQFQGSTPGAVLSQSSINYGTSVILRTTPSVGVTLTNSGNGALAISGITITGTNAADFAQANNCGSSLAAQTSCSIGVTFTPTLATTEVATVSIADNAAGSPQTIALSGVGVFSVPPPTNLQIVITN